MKIIKALFVFVFLFAVYVIAARFLFPVPDISNRAKVSAIAVDPATQLGQLMMESQVEHSGKTGVLQLENGTDALQSRLSIINSAQHSIDSQYYIWHDDISGILLLHALYKASQRGVRVRLLLDDNGVPGIDDFLAGLNAEKKFDVRLFNPSTIRQPKMLGYTFDFSRMNRRMHNKSLTVDGAVTIVGGRNIGDEYFDIGGVDGFLDMDVMATGEVVHKVSSVFDQYWNSQSAHQIETIVDGQGDITAFNNRANEILGSLSASHLQQIKHDASLESAKIQTALEWTDVQLVADDPAKGLGKAKREQLMISRLGAILGGVSSQLDLVSAYFVPGKEGTEFFSNLSQSGKDIRILTNAMNTTDVFLVHAGYARYRREVLEAGIQLYELKLGSHLSTEQKQVLPFGLSGASLHAKTFAVDNKRIFIGSFNFDPRSALLNCEMGFLIDSPTLAQKLTAAFDGPLKNISYLPALTPNGKMIWRENQKSADTLIYQEEPEATWLDQIAITIVGLLPVEWLL